MDTQPIVNKVAASDLVVFDLESFWDGGEVVTLDLAPLLLKGLILKEKDFREAVAAMNPADFEGKHVAVLCSSHAVIPTWAFMLIASKLSTAAASVGHGSPADLIREHLAVQLRTHDWSQYADRNVIVKGCPSDIIPTAAYMEAVSSLQKVASKIMYG